MKVAYLSGSTFPSSVANSIHVFKMSQALVNNGNDVLLIGKTDEPATQTVSKAELKEYYGAEPLFKFKFAPAIKRTFGELRFALNAVKSASNFGAEIFFGRHVIACMVSAFKGKPTIVELHMMPSFTGIKLFLFKRFLASKYLKQIIVITGELKKDLVKEYNLNPDLVSVAHDAADDPKPDYLPESFKADTFNIAYIGNLYPGKGMETLAALIPEAPEGVHFHIVGGKAEEIAKWKQTLAAYNNYTFHGTVMPKDTVAYRYAADALIAPYLREVKSKGGNNIGLWMSPLKLFEYMAAAKPILISDLTVIREVLTHDVDGLLVDPDNIQEWVAQIVRLKDDVTLGERLGKAARAEYESKYTWDQRARFILSKA